MFLDEELKQIYEDNKDSSKCGRLLLEACLKRMKDPEKASTKDCVNSLRSIDYSWKVFCKTHPVYRPNGFRNVVLSFCESKEEQALLKKDCGGD